MSAKNLGSKRWRSGLFVLVTVAFGASLLLPGGRVLWARALIAVGSPSVKLRCFEGLKDMGPPAHPAMVDLIAGQGFGWTLAPGSSEAALAPLDQRLLEWLETRNQTEPSLSQALLDAAARSRASYQALRSSPAGRRAQRYLGDDRHDRGHWGSALKTVRDPSALAEGLRSPDEHLRAVALVAASATPAEAALTPAVQEALAAVVADDAYPRALRAAEVLNRSSDMAGIAAFAGAIVRRMENEDMEVGELGPFYDMVAENLKGERDQLWLDFLRPKLASDHLAEGLLAVAALIEAGDESPEVVAMTSRALDPPAPVRIRKLASRLLDARRELRRRVYEFRTRNADKP